MIGVGKRATASGSVVGVIRGAAAELERRLEVLESDRRRLARERGAAEALLEEQGERIRLAEEALAKAEAAATAGATAVSQIESKLAACEAELATCTQRAGNLAKELDELKPTHIALQDSASKSAAEIAQLREDLAAVNAQLQQAQSIAAAAEAAKMVETAEKDVAVQRERTLNEQLRAGVRSLLTRFGVPQDVCNADCALLTDAIDAAATATDDSRKTLSMLLDELAAERSRRELAEQTANELQTKSADLQAQVTSLAATETRLTEQLRVAGMREIEMKNTIAALEGEKLELATQLNSATLAKEQCRELVLEEIRKARAVQVQLRQTVGSLLGELATELRGQAVQLHNCATECASELATKTTKIAESQRQLAELAETLEAQEAAMEQMRTASRAEVETLTRELDRLVVENRQLGESNTASASRCHELELRLANATAGASQATDAVRSELTAKLDVVQRENEFLKQELDRLSREKPPEKKRVKAEPISTAATTSSMSPGGMSALFLKAAAGKQVATATTMMAQQQRKQQSPAVRFEYVD